MNRILNGARFRLHTFEKGCVAPFRRAFQSSVFTNRNANDQGTSSPRSTQTASSSHGRSRGQSMPVESTSTSSSFQHRFQNIRSEELLKKNLQTIFAQKNYPRYDFVFEALKAVTYLKSPPRVQLSVSTWILAYAKQNTFSLQDRHFACLFKILNFNPDKFSTEEVESLFNSIPKLGHLTLNSMIKWHLINKDVKAALKVLHSIKDYNLKPRVEEFALFLRHHSNSNDVFHATQLFTWLKVNKYFPGTTIYNIMFDLYLKNSDGNLCNDLIEEMDREKIPPDAQTFQILLEYKADSWKGDMNEFWMFLSDMEKSDVTPNTRTIKFITSYVCFHGKEKDIYALILQSNTWLVSGLTLPICTRILVALANLRHDPETLWKCLLHFKKTNAKLGLQCFNVLFLHYKEITPQILKNDILERIAFDFNDNSSMYTSLILCLKHANLTDGKTTFLKIIINHMKARNVNVDLNISLALFDFFVEARDLKALENICDLMYQNKFIGGSSVMALFSKVKSLEMNFVIYYKLQSYGWVFNLECLKHMRAVCTKYGHRDAKFFDDLVFYRQQVNEKAEAVIKKIRLDQVGHGGYGYHSMQKISNRKLVENTFKKKEI